MSGAADAVTRRTTGTVLLLVGAVGALALSGRGWVTGTVVDPVLGIVETTVTGGDAAPAGSAVALLALAGVLAVLLTRGWARRMALVVTALAGLALVGVPFAVLADPGSALAATAEGSVGRGLGEVGQASATWAPWACILAGVALVTGVALVGGDVASGGRAVTAGADDLPEAERDRRRGARDWDRLSGGEDPTQDLAD